MLTANAYVCGVEVCPGIEGGVHAEQPKGKLAFVFPGGAPMVRNGTGRYKTSASFPRTIERCTTAMRPYITWSLGDEMIARPECSRLDEVDVVQPMLFAMQVGLAALWQSWGIAPDAVVGHSMGEIAASCVAGALTLDDAARVICCRSQLVRRERRWRNGRHRTDTG